MSVVCLCGFGVSGVGMCERSMERRGEAATEVERERARGLELKTGSIYR